MQEPCKMQRQGFVFFRPVTHGFKVPGVLLYFWFLLIKRWYFFTDECIHKTHGKKLAVENTPTHTLHDYWLNASERAQFNLKKKKKKEQCFFPAVTSAGVLWHNLLTAGNNLQQSHLTTNAAAAVQSRGIAKCTESQNSTHKCPTKSPKGDLKESHNSSPLILTKRSLQSQRKAIVKASFRCWTGTDPTHWNINTGFECRIHRYRFIL